MGWFGKKREIDPTAEVTELAIARLATHGVQATIENPGARTDTILSASNGERYPLHNLYIKAEGAMGDELHEVVAGHIDSLVESLTQTPISELSDAEFFERIRVRLAPDDPNDTLDLAYARPFADGLLLALCLDSPTSVTWLSDMHLEGRDVDALFAAGFEHVMAEPIDEVAEVVPGITAIMGDSFFTASKVVGLDRLVGTVLPPAPQGVLFGVSHRGVIFAHVVDGLNSIETVGKIAGLIARFAGDDAPGGGLSPFTYHWFEGEVETVAWVAEDGGIAVMGSGRFGTMIGVEPA